MNNKDLDRLLEIERDIQANLSRGSIDATEFHREERSQLYQQLATQLNESEKLHDDYERLSTTKREYVEFIDDVCKAIGLHGENNTVILNQIEYLWKKYKLSNTDTLRQKIEKEMSKLEKDLIAFGGYTNENVRQTQAKYQLLKSLLESEKK